MHGANNAVFVEAEAAGALMFYGAGAGGVQTASAVLGDLVSIARRHVIGGPGIAESTHADLPVLDIGRITTRYAITLEVADEPGVLAADRARLRRARRLGRAARSRPSSGAAERGYAGHRHA